MLGILIKKKKLTWIISPLEKCTGHNLASYGYYQKPWQTHSLQQGPN